MDKIDSKPFAVIRILFGFVWLIDACFKWNPSFLNNFSVYLSDAAQGQSPFVVAWIKFWVKIVGINPHLFGVTVALIETALALALIFGLWTRAAIIGGIIFSLIIWTTAEGFGGPYMAGSTDIGCAIIYVFVFFALWFGHAWEYFSLDNKFSKNFLN